MLLPGIVFLTLYPVQYTDTLEKAGREILRDPTSWPPDTMPGACRLEAATRVGMSTLGGMVLCAALVSFTQPTKRRMIRKAFIALGFMAAANVILCGGGYAFGNHVNRSLEDATARIRRTPMPQYKKTPVPQVPKP